MCVKKTDIGSRRYLLWERGKNKEYFFFNFVETCLKIDGNSYKTAFNFSEWESVYRMGTRCTDLVYVHRLAKSKTGHWDIFDITYERLWMFSTYSIDIGREDGLQIITDKVDEIYLQDENTGAYMQFKEFYL